MIPAELFRLLCPTANAGAIEALFRLIRKGREPFLLLPREGRLAAAALDLYPAQTVRARLARAALRVGFGIGMPLTMKSFALPINAGADFPRFLSGLNGGEWPRFAVMLCNPRALGRRFIFVVFDQHERPFCVVKAGVSAAARALIDAETRCLSALPPETAGIPRVRATFQTEESCALVLDFIEGRSPRVSIDDPGLAHLMSAWVAHDRSVGLSEVPAWQRLCRRADERSLAILQQFDCDSLRFHPAIFHGDFAPWNARVCDGKWTVLDWERGEAVGVPGWDWFHFVVQPAVLAERRSPDVVWKRIDALLKSRAFAEYATRAEIRNAGHFLARAYLLYCVSVLEPTEKLAQFRELLAVALNKPNQL